MSWESSLDHWKTTPPDDRGYCPHCFANIEDAEPVAPDPDYPEKKAKFFRCVACGAVVCEDDILDHATMLREAREEAAIARSEARMDEASYCRHDMT